jgi:hypothetical protein
MKASMTGGMAPAPFLRETGLAEPVTGTGLEIERGHVV